ncbi:MAG: TetR/AcrR family transcriptional regulator [Rhodospirillales bacterium]
MDSVEIADDFGRAPQQGRSRRTMERIIEAAEELFGEHGYDGASVAEIVRRAQSSVGAFYSRFKDKEGLFLHLHARQCHLVITEIDRLAELDQWRDSSLDAILAEVIAAQLAFIRGRRQITRVFILRCAVDRAFRDRYTAAWAQARDKLRGVLLSRRDEIGHPEPDRAVDFVLEVLHGLWANDALHHDSPEVTGHMDDGERQHEMVRLCAAYLAIVPRRTN